MVAVSRHHLWRCVARRTARCLQQLPFLKRIAETKIGDLHVFVTVEQQVFRLKIAVNHALLVAPLDARNDLMKEAGGLWLPHPARGDDVVEELTTTGILHNEV